MITAEQVISDLIARADYWRTATQSQLAVGADDLASRCDARALVLEHAANDYQRMLTNGIEFIGTNHAGEVIA